MINLQGYKSSEEIVKNTKTALYRGFRNYDKKSVLIKTPTSEYPSIKDINRLINEFIITENLNIEGVVRAIALENYNNIHAIIFDDFIGIPLRCLIYSNRINIDLFLQIAIKLTEILSEIHNNNIIHCGINPDNILISPISEINEIEDLQVKITGFGNAYHSLQEDQQITTSPSLYDTFLEYISPEQTGRINRVIDYRSDLYSLGITLYEMLMNDVPFNSDDTLQLIHCQIAQKPIEPKTINKNIPEVISDITIKLLSKKPEERYQSAKGLRMDLKKCQSQFEKAGVIKPFTLGLKDVSKRLLISDKIFGRDKEIELLMQAFDRVCNPQLFLHNNVERKGAGLSLVTGQAGIGKTALINKMHKPVVSKSGYFISSKHEQFTRDIPYSAIIQAFRLLIKQVLSESSEEMQSLREKILENLNPNAQILIDVIPELELIIGKQQAVADVGPREAQNRFNIYFRKFVGIFAIKEHPLVLFIDDLQWADPASLNLIRVLVTDREIQYLLIIGAYREGEVCKSHPLSSMLEEIEKEGIHITDIQLMPLDVIDVNHMIAHMFNCERERALLLSASAHEKTNGNPFFVIQFIKTLYNEKMLMFNHASGWSWDIEKINQIQVTDNVVEFLTNKITKLSGNTQRILKICACIGSSFEIGLLSTVITLTVEKTLSALSESVDEGLIGLAGNVYRFNHDRIQEAVYSIIPDEERIRLHFMIGKFLLEKATGEKVEENIYYIVNKLNHGITQIVNQDEMNDLAKLNLMAGEKAKESTAYSAAVHYLRTGMELLPEDCWDSNYYLAYSILKERAECEYLSGNFDEAENIFNIIIHNARTDVDKANVYNMMIVLCTNKGEIQEAIKLGIEGLKMFGVKIQIQPTNFAIYKELLKLKLRLRGREIEDLINLKDLHDPEQLSIVNLIGNIGTPAHYSNPKMSAYLGLKSINDIYLKYGNTAFSSFAYIYLSALIGSYLGEYELGNKFGRLALDLSEKYNNKKIKCKTDFCFAYFIQHWIGHAREGIKYFVSAYELGIESGDLIYAGHSINIMTLYRFIMGDNLDDIFHEYTKYEDFLRNTKDPFIIFRYIDNVHIYLNLKGLAADKNSFIHGDYNKNQQLNIIREGNNVVEIVQQLINRIITLFLFEKYLECYKLSKELDKIPEVGTLFVAEHIFYYSLTISPLLLDASYTEKNKYWRILKKNQRKMKRWANICPENFLHKYLLLSGEISRISKRNEEAMSLYDEAIASAHDNGYTQNEAIACEVAAKFYLSIGREKIARTYMQEAYNLYKKWGATAKTEQLEEVYSSLLYKHGGIIPTWEDRGESTDINDSTILDFNTMLDVIQAISREIHLDKLLKIIMKAALQNSGARKVFLIKERDNALFILAEGRIISKGMHHDIYTSISNSIPIESSEELSSSIVNYVARTGYDVALNNASNEGIFIDDPYIIKNSAKSILCTPIKHYGRIITIVYLENDLATDIFTTERIDVLKLLLTQAAISIENAQLYREQEIALEKLHRLDKLKDKLIRQYEESKYRILQERMNPHFLFNAIHTIHALIHKDVEVADRAMIVLAEIYHFLMDKSFNSLITFEEEWQFVIHYLEFEKLRFSDTLSFETSKAGNFSDVFIPPLILQPIVGNSIKHGLRQKIGPGFVKVYATRYNDIVSVEILDNGTGLKTDDIYSRSLGNIKARLKYHFEESDLRLRNNQDGGVIASIYFRPCTGIRG
ncbi:MAG: AAA family ATPase [Spirochaetota bacterium]|nr:AAA family ATPase [Spirochaetota bacterium]